MPSDKFFVFNARIIPSISLVDFNASEEIAITSLKEAFRVWEVALYFPLTIESSIFAEGVFANILPFSTEIFPCLPHNISGVISNESPGEYLIGVISKYSRLFFAAL